MNVLIYLLNSAGVALALWIVYRVLLSGWQDHRAARYFLIVSIAAAAVLPALRLAAPVRASGISVSVSLPEYVAGTLAPRPRQFDWIAGIAAGYAFVALALLAWQIAAAVRIHRKIRRGQLRRAEIVTIAEHTGMGPGTLGTTVFFPQAADDPKVLSHELGHIRAGHRFDLVLMNLCSCLFWINPGIWALRRELRLVHEFEADSFATRFDESPEAYARLLLQHVIGEPAAAFTHAFFHHPVKQRITMLFANKPSPAARARRTISVTLAATLIGAGFLLVRCKPEPAPEPITVKFEQPAAAGSAEVFKFVDKMPQFKGDLNEYLLKTINYPEAARAKGAEGRAIVQFVVASDGTIGRATVVRSSGNSYLDDEAMRAVLQMPAWTPGSQNGVAVNVQYSLPITFQLDDSKAGSITLPDGTALPKESEFELVDDATLAKARTMPGNFQCLDENGKLIASGTLELL